MVFPIIFALSLLVLGILFFGQYKEERKGSQNFVTRLASKLDPYATRVFELLSFRWKQVSQTVRYIIFIVIPQRSEEAFKEMKGKAIEKYQKQKDTLMGKKELVNAASASFFLKKMREEKKNIKEGRIDDEIELYE